MLTFEEKVSIFNKLKEQSGSHSPSITSLFKEIDDLKIDVDACFLSNPYATELFFSFLKSELIETQKIFGVIEYYPAQNKSIAKSLSSAIKVPAKNIFIANGAIEGIQAILHRFVKDSIAVPIPTFSSYYEYVQNLGVKCYLYENSKENDYKLDLSLYSRFIRDNNISNCVIINPNNPDGNHLDRNDLIAFLKSHQDLDNIILDESFIHFTKGSNLEIESLDQEILNFQNLIVVKSLSKDFGIAGIRAGYLLMDEKKVSSLLSNGYLWNSSGLAEYFFKKYSDKSFRSLYEEVRLKYIDQTEKFYDQLKTLKGIHIIKSKSNFFLAEILNKKTSSEVFMELLFKHNIYVRDCSDKIGLNGEYIRIAARSKEENTKIFNALKNVL